MTDLEHAKEFFTEMGCPFVEEQGGKYHYLKFSLGGNKIGGSKFENIYLVFDSLEGFIEMGCNK